MDKIHQSTQPPERFEFIAGQPCLDFANTVDGRRGAVETELLTSYADLVAWSLQAHLLTKYEADRLLKQAADTSEEAAAALERAYSLREALYGIFSALSTQKQPAFDDLETLNKELEQAMAGARVVATADGFALTWGKRELALDQLLGPIARSAAELLTSEERSLVRQCASASCGWLFVDATKNHRRRWCSAMACGNRARVQRHRQRKREASQV
jgi:predicted RNA-binding Zn ribbon-like protein